MKKKKSPGVKMGRPSIHKDIALALLSGQLQYTIKDNYNQALALSFCIKKLRKKTEGLPIIRKEKRGYKVTIQQLEGYDTEKFYQTKIIL